MPLFMQQFGQHFLNGDLSYVYNHFSDDFKAHIKFEQLQELARFVNQGVSYYGRHWSTKEGALYHDIWQDNRKANSISVQYDDKGFIHYLHIEPNDLYNEHDILWTRLSYAMPINDVWTVYSGGPNAFLHKQTRNKQLRFAYLLTIEKEGQKFREDGHENEHYFAYNANVVAPAHGKVVKIVHHIPDHAPFVRDEQHRFGNYVLIDHGHHEFSVVAHLKQHSIVVQVGDFVRPQQLLGVCGNSGNIDIPMLHFHVMNKRSLQDGESLRINFRNGIEPIAGQIVRPFQIK